MSTKGACVLIVTILVSVVPGLAESHRQNSSRRAQKEPLSLSNSCLSPPPMIELFRRVGVSISYYDITTSHLVDIPRSMRSAGPVDDEGTRRDALLSWHIWWRWDLHERPIADTVRVQSSSRLILPRWCPGVAPSDEERLEWARYLTRVLEHEAGHATLFIEHLKNFQSRLSSFFSKCNDCSATDGNHFGFRLVNELNAAQKDYDEKTIHGATQDARLHRSFVRGRWQLRQSNVNSAEIRSSRAVDTNQHTQG